MNNSLKKLVRQTVGMTSAQVQQWFEGLAKKQQGQLIITYIQESESKPLPVEIKVTNYGATSRKPSLDYYDRRVCV